MNLSQSDISLFYKLWYGLVWGINEKHRVIPRFEKPVYGTRVTASIEDFVKIRDAMWDHPAWIDEFLADHDYGEYTEQERGIILDWRKHFVKGKFLVMKHLAKYSVLMTFESNPALLYGVCGISDPIKNTFANPVPFLAEFVLLPFKGKIIYDSLVSMFNITFGSSLRSSAREMYCEAKDKFGIIEALGGNAPGSKPPPEKQKEKTSKAAAVASYKTNAVPKEARVPKAMAARYLEVASIIEKFCDERLTAEYKEICLHALAKLCRKRPSPLVSGKANTWACGIVYAIGSSNFIFERSQPVHMTAAEISGWFGLAKSTAGNKASEIGGLLDLSYMNTEFMLKSLIDNNPAIWLLSVNGYIIDIRDAPYEAQAEAFRRGLIPYIPNSLEKGDGDG